VNSDYVQNLRYKLQKRFRRVNSAGWEAYHWSVKQFWDFLQSHSALIGILDDLGRRGVEYEANARSILDGQAWLAESELEAAANGRIVLSGCADSKDDDKEIMIGHAYPSAGSEHQGAAELFTAYFVEPLYEYVDEQLDDQRAILALLRRYKHKCEWFQRHELHGRWESNTGQGEKMLVYHLYEYLHDQGLDFHIEPVSASGEVDIISAQASEEPLLADAKIFNPGHGADRAYLAAGVKQVYTYAVDFNEPVAYLVVYKTCPEDLRLALSDQSAGTPFLVHNNKTIFVIVIDIYPHEKPASKRGRLKPIEVTEKDLVKVIKG